MLSPLRLYSHFRWIAYHSRFHHTSSVIAFAFRSFSIFYSPLYFSFAQPHCSFLSFITPPPTPGGLVLHASLFHKPFVSLVSLLLSLSFLLNRNLFLPHSTLPGTEAQRGKLELHFIPQSAFLHLPVLLKLQMCFHMSFNERAYMCCLARVLSRMIWRYIYFQLGFRNYSNDQHF